MSCDFAITLRLLALVGVCLTLGGCSHVVRPSDQSRATDQPVRPAPTTAPTSTKSDGNMRAQFTCPAGKPIVEIDGQTVTVKCPE
jgi:hypothetical protein